MKFLLTAIVLFGVFAPNNTFYAQKNRISLQYGVFHLFFDETPLINTQQTSVGDKNLRFPLSFFGGYLNDSWGGQFKRIINPNSSLSCEYMLYRGNYKPIFTDYEYGPQIDHKRLNKINVTYLRKLILNEKWKFNYGAGVNMQWGWETYFIRYNNSSFLKEPFFFKGIRKDFGINLRAGIEYSPIKQLTLFTYLDFQNTLLLESKGVLQDGSVINTYTYFKKEHSVKQWPSRFDLSLNFGIGYNFSWGSLFKSKK